MAIIKTARNRNVLVQNNHSISVPGKYNQSAERVIIESTEKDIKLSTLKKIYSTGNSDNTTMKIGIVKATSMTIGNPSGRGRSAGAGIAIAVNTINYVLENLPKIALSYDKSKIEDHYEILVKNVIQDIITAYNTNIIPTHHRTAESFYALCNIILCGYSEGIDEDNELYKLEKKIYKDISKLEKK